SNGFKIPELWKKRDYETQPEPPQSPIIRKAVERAKAAMIVEQAEVAVSNSRGDSNDSRGDSNDGRGDSNNGRGDSNDGRVDSDDTGGSGSLRSEDGYQPTTSLPYSKRRRVGPETEERHAANSNSRPEPTLGIFELAMLKLQREYKVYWIRRICLVHVQSSRMRLKVGLLMHLKLERQEMIS
ncbi:hypothetical protein RUND412_011279, partial [Rhizina undulata]